LGPNWAKFGIGMFLLYFVVQLFANKVGSFAKKWVISGCFEWIRLVPPFSMYHKSYAIRRYLLQQDMPSSHQCILSEMRSRLISSLLSISLKKLFPKAKYHNGLILGIFYPITNVHTHTTFFALYFEFSATRKLYC